MKLGGIAYSKASDAPTGQILVIFVTMMFLIGGMVWLWSPISFLPLIQRKVQKMLLDLKATKHVDKYQRLVIPLRWLGLYMSHN